MKESYDDKAIVMATYGLNDLQFKIYNELKLDPITILYHYDKIYDDNKYTFKDKLTIIIETMIKILMTSIENGYISVNLAEEAIAKLRKHIKSLTDIGKVEKS